MECLGFRGRLSERHACMAWCVMYEKLYRKWKLSLRGKAGMPFAFWGMGHSVGHDNNVSSHVSSSSINPQPISLYSDVFPLPWIVVGWMMVGLLPALL